MLINYSDLMWHYIWAASQFNVRLSTFPWAASQISNSRMSLQYLGNSCASFWQRPQTVRFTTSYQDRIENRRFQSDITVCFQRQRWDFSHWYSSRKPLAQIEMTLRSTSIWYVGAEFQVFASSLMMTHQRPIWVVVWTRQP